MDGKRRAPQKDTVRWRINGRRQLRSMLGHVIALLRSISVERLAQKVKPERGME